MEPTPSKLPAFYTPKKMYTFMLQQQKDQEQLQSGKGEGNPEASTSGKGSVSQSGHGEKKFPLPGENEDNTPHTGPDRDKSVVVSPPHKKSRGKTGKHLRLLASMETTKDKPGEDQIEQQTPPADEPVHTSEAGIRPGPLYNKDIHPKRTHDSRMSIGKDISSLIDSVPPMESGQQTSDRDLMRGGHYPQRPSMDVCRSTVVDDAALEENDFHIQEVHAPTFSPPTSTLHVSRRGRPSLSDRPRPSVKSGAVGVHKRFSSEMCNEITSSLSLQVNDLSMPKHVNIGGANQPLEVPDRLLIDSGPVDFCDRIKTEPDSGTGPEKTKTKMEQRSCMVCGDIAAGFHCGAYVCEACKKFFVRCLKQDVGNKFVCSRNKTCVVNRETRTQCQFCRYQKCLKLGMYKPGSGPGGGKFGAEISHIPCKVCESPSSGYHFGAITCEGCKGFFRRTVKERAGVRYVCSRNGDCNITVNTRNVCKYCRYQKCLQAGMTPDGSRIGRQPNAVKHATMLELQRLHCGPGDTVISEVKKEVASPQSETPDMFSDSNHFELIDPSNLPDDLLVEDDDGKLKPRAMQLMMGKGLDPLPIHKDEDSARIHRGKVIESMSPRLEQDGLMLYKPAYSEPQRRPITAGKAQYSGGSFREPAQASPEVGRQEHSHIQQHPQRRSSEGRPTEVHAGPYQSEMARYSPEDMSPHHLPPHTLVRERVASCFQEDIETQALELQHIQHLARIEALTAQQQELKRQEAQKSMEIEAEINKLASHSHYMKGISQFKASANRHLPSHQEMETSAILRGQAMLDSLPQRREVYSRATSNDTSSSYTSPDSARYTLSVESEPSPVECLPKIDTEAAQYSQSNVYDTDLHNSEAPVCQKTAPTDTGPPRFEQQRSYHGTEDTDPDMPTDLSTTVSPRRDMAPPRKSNPLKIMEKIPEKYMQFMAQITQVSLRLRPILQKSNNCQAITRDCSTVEMWATMMGQFHQCAKSVIAFARRVPGFQDLPVSLQIAKVQMAMYPIVLIVLSTQYDVEKRTYNYFHMTVAERDIVFELFPGFRILDEHFHRMGHAIKFVEMDDIEIAFLCALILVTSDASPGEDNTNPPHAHYESDLAEALFVYCREKEGDQTNRDGYILARLAEANRCNAEHQKAIYQIMMTYPQLEIPQLFEETYLST